MTRTAVEAGLRSVWEASTRSAAVAGLALAPLETAFAAAVALRNRRYDSGRGRIQSAGVPVVSVGNLAVGGTGKTPFAAWLAALLTRRGVAPGIVTNGYARDEVSLHRRWNPGVPVAADRRRARAAAAVVGQGAEVVILDDGFQHRTLARDLDLVLVAAEHPTPVRLLPRGPYREPERALRRAHAVVVTRRGASFDEARRRGGSLAATHGIPCVLVRLTPSGWRDLAGASVPAPSGAVLALSGIANPRQFHGLLEREHPGMEMEPMVFADHHEYSAADVTAIAGRARGRTVVTTAKDAVKLGRLGEFGVDTRVLHLEVEVEEGREWLECALPGGPAAASTREAGDRPPERRPMAGRIAARERGSEPEIPSHHVRGGQAPRSLAGGKTP